LIAKLQNFLLQLTYLPKAWRLAWAAAPSWTLAWMLLLIVQGGLPAATVYLSRLLIDNLVAAIDSGGAWEQVRPVVVIAVLTAGAVLLTVVLQSVITWVRTAQAEFVQDHLSELIHKKSAAVDLAFYETPEYFDRLHRAREDASSRPLSLLESGGGLLQNGITLIAMGAILIPYGLWLPIFLVISTLPAFFIVLRFNWLYHRWWEQTTADRRRTGYYDFLLTHSVVAAELRLFDLGAYFQTAFQALRRRLRNERLKLTKDQSLAQLGAGLIAGVVSAVALAWIGWRTIQGLATLGDLVLFYQAFNQGQSLMRTLLQNIGRIYSNSLFLSNLFEFLALEPQVTDPVAPISPPSVLQQGIHFREVTFRYPGSERVTLQNFNLMIPAGQIVAIVGENGAGKSTLIKLLCRLYNLDAGCIEFDGVDIQLFSLEDLRRQITMLFQLPVLYQATAAENIGLGDISMEASRLEIETAARGAGAHEVIERLPNGYDTVLGKWFAGGTELSAGEWQRIALARAFLRQAQLIILDEPTSFMDSWAEAKWVERFRTLAGGQTALVITHRFTTAMQADVIHVMHEGQIIESGSHADLLAQGGRYAQSWIAQTQADISSPV